MRRKALDPPPANLAWSTKRPLATDGYLDWTITEGGAPLQTAMPSFKGVLTEHQIWQLIGQERMEKGVARW